MTEQLYEFGRKNLKAHIELSNYCNAMCPMCGRNKVEKEAPNKLKLNPGLNNSELLVTDMEKMFDDEFMETYGKNFKVINFCGNKGDPATATDLFEIFDFFYEKFPGIQLKVATNGGLKTKTYWKKVGELFSKHNIGKEDKWQSRVTFGIDGLEDTNHIYRVNVNYKKVMENAKAFIDAGGRAEWQWLTFGHNEHQLKEAQQLSLDMGFSGFYEVHTPRFVYDSNGTIEPGVRQYTHKNKTYVYETADPDFDAKYLRIRYMKQYDISKVDEIDCKAKKINEFYLDCKGNVYPCCWLGGDEHMYLTSGHWNDKIIEEDYDFNGMNAKENSLTQILNSKFMNEIIPNSWKDLGPKCRAFTCKKFCAKKNNIRKQRTYLNRWGKTIAEK